MPPHPAQQQGYTGGVMGPGANQPTPFGPNTWSPENPALGQYNELYNKNLGMQAFSNAANTPLSSNPLIAQAMQGLTGASQFGQQGMAALGGDASAMQNFMNPYTQNVLQQMQTQWGQQNQGLLSQLGAQAAGQNAFGGSREGLAEGAGLSQNMQNQALQGAQLQQQGLYNAQNLAENAAQMGQGANQQLNQMGVQQSQWTPQMLAEGFNAYPQMVMNGGQATPGSANGAQQLIGSIGALGPLLMMGK